jgi:ActR/RegA family two-component response regulator
MDQQAPKNDLRAQMFDLIIEANDLYLVVLVGRNNRGVHSVAFAFDTTDAQCNIGKKRMTYGIPDLLIAADDGQEVVDQIRNAFEKVRAIDKDVAEREAADKLLKRSALAKLTDEEKRALKV